MRRELPPPEASWPLARGGHSPYWRRADGKAEADAAINRGGRVARQRRTPPPSEASWPPARGGQRHGLTFLPAFGLMRALEVQLPHVPVSVKQ